MNKRIFELAKQANLTEVIDDCYLERNDWQPFVGKFAELIVRMCADYADMAHDAGCEYIGDYVGEAMGYGEEEGVANWRTTSDVEPAVQPIKPSPPPSRVMKEYCWRTK